MTAGMADVLMQIDGRPASAADLGHFALSNYGAFTSMQVEDGGVRGLDLHLARLETDALELFGVAVPEALLRERMRQVLDGRPGRFSLTQSMSRRGNCLDNAAMESWNHSLKVEAIHGERFATREQAKAHVFEYIEVDYNRNRLHSTLGYLSPDEFELFKAA